MAGQIRITPDTMRERASQYTQQANNVEDIINTMQSLLETLQTEWEGSASEAYAERWNSDLKPSFVSAKELIDEIAEALTETARILEETDTTIATQFRG